MRRPESAPSSITMEAFASAPAWRNRCASGTPSHSPLLAAGPPAVLPAHSSKAWIVLQRMMQDIKECGAKLKLHGVLDGAQPLDREIHIESRRSRKDVADRIAERPSRSGLKRLGRKPLSDTVPERPASQRWFGDH